LPRNLFIGNYAMSDATEISGYLSGEGAGIIDLPEAAGAPAAPETVLRAERRSASSSEPGARLGNDRLPTVGPHRLKLLLLAAAALMVIVGSLASLSLHRSNGTIAAPAPHAQESGTSGSLGTQTQKMYPQNTATAAPLTVVDGSKMGTGQASHPENPETAGSSAPIAPGVAPDLSPSAVQDTSLALVTSLTLKVQEMQHEQQALSAQMVQANQGFQAQLAALSTQMAQQQAKDDVAIAAASKVAPLPAAQVASVTAPTQPPAQSPVDPSSYNVQAASPGVAILDRDGEAFEVGVGEMVPGVGKVTSIDQSGTGWIVHTTNGQIN
jgi:hypothetical protein